MRTMAIAVIAPDRGQAANGRIEIAWHNPVERLAIVGGKLNQLVLSRLTGRLAGSTALAVIERGASAVGAEIVEPAIDQVIAHCLLRVAAGLALSTAKPTALSRHRRKPSVIGVPERVHFTEF
jgi:hypothetical protein